LKARRKNPFWDYPVRGFTLVLAVRNEPYKKLCELLIQERQKAEITQADLSARLKRPQSFVSKYERGERRLDVVEFGRVAAAIGFDPVHFLSNFYRGNV
jgi:cyanate lyase